MSLQTRIQDFITAVGTDYKQLRTWITGSNTGTLTGLSTTVKTDLISAINEVNAKPSGTSAVQATETISGIGEVATQAEMTTGTDDLRIVTPLKHRVDSDARYQPKSANLTSLSGFTVSTAQALGTSDTVLPTQAAVKAYADGLIDANNAFRYKGTLDASTNPNYPAGNAGDVYKVSVAGRVGGASGPVVEVGDTVTLLVDNSLTGNHATVGANWIITQSNIDGAVVGPASSTAGNLVTFSGTTGKVVQDGAVAVTTDTALATNTNAVIPTVLALRTYLTANFYNKTEIGNPETDLVAAYTAAKA